MQTKYSESQNSTRMAQMGRTACKQSQSQQVPVSARWQEQQAQENESMDAIFISQKSIWMVLFLRVKT